MSSDLRPTTDILNLKSRNWMKLAGFASFLNVTSEAHRMISLSRSRNILDKIS